MLLAKIKNRAIVYSLRFLTMLVPRKTPDLLMGEGSAVRLCKLIAGMEISKLFLVTDKDLTDLGLYTGMVDALEADGVEVVVFDEVEPNPTEAQIQRGVDLMRSRSCDAVLAVGGGSVMDAAKVMAGINSSTRTVAQMEGWFKVRGEVLPLFVVPTTAGTGSEATVAAVVSNPDEKRKYAVLDIRLMPKMAALDTDLMKGLPPHITANTGMDALTHAVEAYISIICDKDSRQAARQAVKLIFGNLHKAYENGSDVAARDAMAYASYLAGFAFSQAGVGYVHAIAHQFGGRYHVPHGLANAVLLPHVLESSKVAARDRLAELAELIGCTGGSKAAMADAFIDRVKLLSQQVGVPTTLDSIQAGDVESIFEDAQKEAINLYAVPEFFEQPTGESIVRALMV